MGSMETDSHRKELINIFNWNPIGAKSLSGVLMKG